ncbi:hypothetical protein [Rhizobium giardinii]|uniref:hypothetical protein n=1 Tax=Rhizobium giardinii TaxID=56731 RepID=UPI001FD93CA1|nr:hypothetical protein [Rhizobium giardinii]
MPGKRVGLRIGKRIDVTDDAAHPVLPCHFRHDENLAFDLRRRLAGGWIDIFREPSENGRPRLAVGAEPPFDLSPGVIERLEAFEDTVDIGLAGATVEDALPQVAFLEVDRVVHQALALQRDAAAFDVFRRKRLAMIGVQIGIAAVIGPGGGGRQRHEKDQRNCACVGYHQRSSYPVTFRQPRLFA